MIMGPYIAKYNVGYSCQVDQPSVDHCRVLDLMNHFNSGVEMM